MILYELGGLNGRRYSQFSWRTHMAMAHKGLSAESRAVPVSDKQAIAFSGQDKVPILVDGDQVIADSWAIAEHLERRYADRPSLFGGAIGQALCRFVNAYVDRTLIPKLVPLLMIDVVACVGDEDAHHLRQQMEQVFRRPLEQLAAERDKDILAFRKLLDPARATLRSQPFLCGEQPAYADHILFSLFQWARIVSRFEVLEPSDRLAAWREAMLDRHDGLARKEPARSDATPGHRGG
ncbi:glutathione S-transferase family protein [Phreatobacter stygius]|uniref:Glutathione S-transferase family protein n=1 Tax=Phreatobacter stygius TaxID=1940610 RepID=A0A4D7BET9_9HYPH|nr:glutathione S-transferase family protein [Phreatobacter stygius]